MFDNELHYYDVVDGQAKEMVSIKKSLVAGFFVYRR